MGLKRQALDTVKAHFLSMNHGIPSQMMEMHWMPLYCFSQWMYIRRFSQVPNLTNKKIISMPILNEDGIQNGTSLNTKIAKWLDFWPSSNDLYYLDLECAFCTALSPNNDILKMWPPEVAVTELGLVVCGCIESNLEGIWGE